MEASTNQPPALHLSAVEAVTYLTGDRVAFHRPIVAFLYDRYEEAETGWVWAHEVTAYIQRVHPDGGSYSEDECRRDLKTLARWGVLIPEHDESTAATLKELHGGGRYHISPLARRLERTVRDLENEDGV